jgi:hypothetical protein
VVSLLLPVLVPVLVAVVFPENPLEPLRNRIRNAKVIEEPLVAMASVVLELLLLSTPAAPVAVPPAPCRHPWLTEFSLGDTDTLPMCIGAWFSAHNAKTRILRVLGVVCAGCGHCRALGEAGHDVAVKGGGTGNSESSMLVVDLVLGLILKRAES